MKGIKSIVVLGLAFLVFAVCGTSLHAQTLPWSFQFDTNQNLIIPNASNAQTTRFVIGIYDTSGYGSNEAWWVNHLDTLLNGEVPLAIGATPAAQGLVDVYINYYQGASPLQNRLNIGNATASLGMAWLDTENTGLSNIWTTSSTGQPILDTAALLPIVQVEKGQPGQLGYYTADEPCNTNPGVDYSKVSQLHSFFDAQWPQAVQYGVMRANDPFYVYNGANDPCSKPGYEFTGEMSDLLTAIGTDPYLIFWSHPLANIVNFVPDTLVWANAPANLGGVRFKPYWYVQQLWGYTNGIDGWPTAEEMRRESWTAICEGVNGIFFWSFGAKGLAYVTEPQRGVLFAEWLSDVQEIKSYQPELTGTPIAFPETLPRGVIGIARQTSDGVTHVFTINTSETTISDSNGHRWAPGQTIFW